MTPPRATTGLRSARTARGWSQAQAARELVALARTRGAPVAEAPSLKTLLSRWENGHAVPEPQYRALLSELYGRTAAELGIAGPPPADRATPDSPARLRAALAAAAALDDAALALWREQLELAARLDAEFGAAGAGELTGALVERLDHTLRHLVAPEWRAAVAGLLAAAAALAGDQDLDSGRPAEAWQRYHLARTAAEQAPTPEVAAVAAAGQVAVLVDVGEPAAAIALLDSAEPALPPIARPRIAAARAVATAALGDADGTRRVIAATAELPRIHRMDLTVPLVAVELTDLDRWHGHALAVLGDVAATTPLRRALAAPPRSVRRRAAVHADLALALAGSHPEESEHHAREARTLAERIGSHRTVARLALLHPTS